ncbi:hypothetical protein GCM10010435_65920 [Winogradskya consettensis]|uniref:Uncharacterized protein n=1 Tax=Winogradskya consettensis TaxID=113560 RepID=A0A919T2R7_9ACTN|nr:hypothetical protein [Actinoplanes consettensis]GIM84789.1 hypothetical protein Aco04nite_93160 [Actinoplanes consettensis]
MTDYLYEAAALLRKASEMNEKKNHDDSYHSTRAALIEGRERIAMKFAQLAAIERGLIPADMVGDLLTQLARSEAPR